MKNLEIAKRYAAALSELAQEKVSVFEDDLTAVLNVLDDDGTVEEFFQSPRIARDEKISIFKKVFQGKVNDVVLNFILVLILKRREDILKDTTAEFIKENDRILGRVRAEATLARAIPNSDDENSVRAEIEKAILERRLDFGITKDDKVSLQTKTRVKSDILGGVIVRVGDHLMDASVRRYLHDWRQKVIARKISLEKGWNEL